MINWFIDKSNELFENIDKLFEVETPPLVDKQMLFPFYIEMAENK